MNVTPSNDPHLNMCEITQSHESGNARPGLSEVPFNEFEALFTLSMEMLCIADFNGFFKLVNPTFARTLGYDVEELLARPFMEFVHPDDCQATIAELDKLTQGLPTISFENRYRCRDRSWRWLSWKAAPDQARKRIYAVAHDVTRRKASEMQLRESEQRYHRLLKAVTSYHYSVILHNGVPVGTEHSPDSLSATGYSPQDFAEDPYLWFRIIHPADRERVQSCVARVLANEAVPLLEHRIVRRDGSIRWVRDTIILHRDAAGLLVRYDGVVEDVTERKQAEERFQQLFEMAPDALVLFNQEGRIELANIRAEQLFGYPRQELLGSPLERLIPPAARQTHEAHFRAFFSSPRTRAMSDQMGLRCLRRDGTEIPVEISLSPVDTSYGLLVCAAIRDVTEREEALWKIRDRDFQLLKSREDLEHLRRLHERTLVEAEKMELVGRLSAGVAHEVKNPLAIIQMALECLAQEHLPQRQEQFPAILKLMQDAVQRADVVVRGLLDFSAPLELHAQNVDVNALIAKTYHLVKHELLRGHIAWQTDLAPDLPPLRLDVTKIEQVLVNLIVNAVHAMPNAGTLTARTHLTEISDAADVQRDGSSMGRLPAGHYVAVDVEDTGTGIPAEHLPKIFDPFFTTKPLGVGTGLGLAVAKAIVEQHQGHIEIRNRTQGGVIASILLPVIKE